MKREEEKKAEKRDVYKRQVPTWKLADGTLADGQQEIAHVEGSQTLVGESENKITDLKIFANAASQEAEGSETEAQDVTKNYSIILLAGLLKVTDGSEEDPVDPGQVVTCLLYTSNTQLLPAIHSHRKSQD